MSPVVIFALFSFLLGAAVGSFLNVCIYRLPAGESVVSPPSRCPACGARIRPWHNIPILGWLILRGKCRDCGAPISPRYPFVELLNGLLTLALFLKFGPSPTFLVLFVFCSALVAVTFIDLDHQLIPDVISLPGIVVGFACSFALPWLGWKSSLIGIVAGGGSLLSVARLYELLTKKEGMGGGDIKLLAMMGAFLGWRSVPFIIFASSLIGSVIGVTLMLVQKKDSKLAIPFGPFLATGAVLYIFFGKTIITWYLTLGAR
ncbi:Prepilin peptidase [Geobacter metallireducens RCH3]|uniref:Prepilin leader peptidase/N-methyltransferase n=1 Tax=Geobacter metallireducens (strain ATCC 53774 / DSM 7210 / GS-15) TaxID=269799 RepID=Q39X23_GEOMG|nr:A24 family peptidase [Geobacter metallireducens]ABB31201.1 type IV prepilin-like proteins leader peptide processing enzyme [Geobacter metallireducens GS-15]EHP84598.1 Prepilin peptidase [Geobacter metallireducens RCH3]